MAIQRDSKIIAGGAFKRFAGEARQHLVRVHPNGALDTSFAASANDWVRILVLQEDGKVIVAGNFEVLNNKARAGLGRFNPDGSLDMAFDPNPDKGVYGLALQPDGRVIVGGTFTSLARESRPYLGRLNPDGTLDKSFNPQLERPASGLALQPDGKILVSTTRGLTRLNPDGTSDPTFKVVETSFYPQILVQPDGKIHYGLKRYYHDGTPDPAFEAGISGIFNSIAQQADGKVLLAGKFRDAGTSIPLVGTNGYVIRLNPDGSRDNTFDLRAEGGPIETIMLQNDGKLVVGGWFGSINGVQRFGLARFQNTEAATESLVLANSTLLWLRSATSPEFCRVVFETTSDGINWHSLGAGTRVPTGWQLANVTLPPGGSIRARGFVAVPGSSWHGAGFSLESGIGAPFISVQPANQSTEPGQTVVLSVHAEGSGPLSYQWLFSGKEMPGDTAETLAIQDVDETKAGEYSVVITGSSGSVTSSVAVVSLSESFRPPLALRALTAIPTPGHRILVEGEFWTWEGDQSYTLGRLQPDGTWDTSFTPRKGTWSRVLAVQPDGRTLMFDNDNPDTVKRDLVRLDKEGKQEASFSPQVKGYVSGVALQPDEKILIWGDFASVGGQACTNFARLNSDGTLDQEFRRGAEGRVSAVAWLDPEQLLVAGAFTSVGGQACTNLARLSGQGILDQSFRPAVQGTYLNVLVQRDQKMLVFGSFTNVAGSTATFGRLNTDGTWDTTFKPAAPFDTDSVAQQANGKLLVASRGVHSLIRRLNPDGSADPEFVVGVEPHSLALQSDGAVLVAIYRAGSPQSVMKLENDESAAQHLSFDGNTIIWTRAGSCPELSWAKFEGSTNGVEWLKLGTGIRVADGWQLTGIHLPDHAQIRAIGQVSVISGVGLSMVSYPDQKAIGRPFILEQPGDQTRPVGTPTSFSVGTEGTGPVFYQWFFNDTPIPRQTNALLRITSVQQSNEGVYSVSISNAYGALTSSNARLTAIEVPAIHPPEIRSVNLMNDAIQLTWATQIGGVYRLEYSSDLDRNDWTPVGESRIFSISGGYSSASSTDVISSAGTSLTLTDKFRENSRLFYRLIVLPRHID